MIRRYHVDIYLTSGSTAIVCGYSCYNTAKGALEKLNISNNKIISHSDNGKASGKVLSDMIAANTVLREFDVSKNGEYNVTSGSGFAEEFAVGLGTNRAMTSLNISSNYLGAEGAKHIAAALPECK